MEEGRLFYRGIAQVTGCDPGHIAGLRPAGLFLPPGELGFSAGAAGDC